ncbi:MAG TPA: type II secretion system protein [Actinomycetota bacterium]|nr:type II secretion system protein [Actinomycetota bacterium]
MRLNLSDDRGITLVELLVAAAIGLAVSVLAGAGLMSMTKGERFVSSQSQSLDDARLAFQQLTRDIRGADHINWCAPSGSCLEVGAQTPTGTFHTVRYSHSGTELTRSVYDPVAATWATPRTILQRVANSTTRRVFACDTQSTLLRVNVDLQVLAAPQSGTPLNMYTSIRPRNFPSKSNCP